MMVLELVEQMFERYGYLVLLIGLPLDLIALPLPPGQLTLTYTGYLSYKGVLEWLPAWGMAFAGSTAGITITYAMGYKLGIPLLERYGRWLNLKPAHLEKTRQWYDKYGNKMLLVSYFIPGVRQFFGYFAGIMRVPYRTFAMYAYTGAGLWVTAFVGIGFVFGEQWQYVFLLAERYLKYMFIGLGGLMVGLLFLKRRNRSKARAGQARRRTGER